MAGILSYMEEMADCRLMTVRVNGLDGKRTAKWFTVRDDLSLPERSLYLQRKTERVGSNWISEKKTHIFEVRVCHVGVWFPAVGA